MQSSKHWLYKLSELRGRVGKFNKNLNKDIGNIKIEIEKIKKN